MEYAKAISVVHKIALDLPGPSPDVEIETTYPNITSEPAKELQDLTCATAMALHRAEVLKAQAAGRPLPDRREYSLSDLILFAEKDRVRSLAEVVDREGVRTGVVHLLLNLTASERLGVIGEVLSAMAEASEASL